MTKANTETSPPEVDLDAVVADLAPRIAGQRLIVGSGFLCGYDGYVRAGVVTADAGAAGSMCWEGYLPEADLPALKQKLGGVATVRPGTIDFSHATPWSWAWTAPSDQFLLVDRRGIKARVEGDTLVVRRRLRGDLRTHRSQIRRITARVSSGWTHRTVNVETDNGERTLVSSWTMWPIFGGLFYFYGGLELMADTIWLESLAKCLAESLQVPVDLPK